MLLKLPRSEFLEWIRLPTVHLAKDLADYRRTFFVPLERKLYGDTLCRIAVGKTVRKKKVLHEHGWEEAPTWDAWCVLLTTCTWDGLNANAKPTTFSLTSTARCSSHEFLQQLLKSWQVLQKWTRMSLRGPTTWRDMHRNAWNGTANLQNKKHQAIVYKVSTPGIDDHQFKKQELETVGEVSKFALTSSWNVFIWRASVDLTFSGL